MPGHDQIFVSCVETKLLVSLQSDIYYLRMVNVCPILATEGSVDDRRDREMVSRAEVLAESGH